jgi:heme-degrading monooxygenase HmoA
LWDLAGAEAGGLSILRASIATVSSPSIPRGGTGWIGKISPGGAAIGHLLCTPSVGQIQGPAAQVLRHLPLLLVGEWLGRNDHRAGCHRLIDVLRSELHQSHEVRRARVRTRILVAGRAVLGKDRRAGRSGQRIGQLLRDGQAITDQQNESADDRLLEEKDTPFHDSPPETQPESREIIIDPAVSCHLAQQLPGRLPSARLTVESPLCGDRGQAMVARVTRYRIRAGKIDEFTTMMKSLMTSLDTLAGFRMFLLVRGEDPSGRDATSISVWDSAENMQSSENNSIYYEAIKSLMGCCESFSPMHQHEVLEAKIAPL